MAMICVRPLAARRSLRLSVGAAAQGFPIGPLKPANGVVKAPF